MVSGVHPVVVGPAGVNQHAAVALCQPLLLAVADAHHQPRRGAALGAGPLSSLLVMRLGSLGGSAAPVLSSSATAQRAGASMSRRKGVRWPSAERCSRARETSRQLALHAKYLTTEGDDASLVGTTDGRARSTAFQLTLFSAFLVSVGKPLFSTVRPCKIVFDACTIHDGAKLYKVQMQMATATQLVNSIVAFQMGATAIAAKINCEIPMQQGWTPVKSLLQ